MAGAGRGGRARGRLADDVSADLADAPFLAAAPTLAAVAGAACARGVTVVTGWDAVATSYPGFAETLERLAGDR